MTADDPAHVGDMPHAQPESEEQMAEKEAEVTEQTDEEAEKNFSAGFGEDAPPAAAATPSPAAETTEASTVDARAQEEPPAEPAPAEPKYAQLTEDDVAILKAAAAETASLKQQLSKAFGTMGNMQQLINQVRSQTPAGAAVEITDEDFAELQEDFPELAGHTRAALERILKRANLKGTGEQPATPVVDPETVRTTAAEIVHQQGIDDLNDLHPGWQAIVVSPEYREWLGKQPQDYQTLLHSTYSATITGRSIDRFLAAKPKPANPQTPARQPSARRAAIEAAVQPRGTGTPPAPRQPTAEENFNAGFNS